MATLQKLLWSEEYSEFGDEVVLVEGRFVLEKKHGECLCMVHAGLTRTVVLIAEENVDLNAEHLRTVVVSSDASSNVEYLHLAHLFPLQSTKLSTRRHQEHRGEHVLRLRLSTGKTWYLELADRRHREDKWREWLSWIHDVDEKRHERRSHGAKGQRQQGGSDTEALEDHSGDASEGGLKTRHTTQTEAINSPLMKAKGDLSMSVMGNQESAAALAAAQRRNRRESRAYHWVGHFQTALSRDHDGQISANDHDLPDMGLLGHSAHDLGNDHHSHISMSHGHDHMSRFVVKDPTASLVWNQPCGTGHSLPYGEASISSTDTFSSLADIESIGSLVGDANMDWMHPLSDEINRKLLLCVGDLFQKFNIEAHGHGHVGRWRPMASLTAVNQLKDSDITTPCRKRSGLPLIPGKETLFHRCSLPDVLEGEASFLDDMHQAADVVHRESLVYMDLVNEDDAKTPHVIGGHVMLLSPEQTKLQEEIARSREMAIDLEFVAAEGRGFATTAENENVGNANKSGENIDQVTQGKKLPQVQERSMGDSLKGRLHLRRRVNHEGLRKQQGTTSRYDAQKAEHLSTRILAGIWRRKKLGREGKTSLSRSHRIASVQEIDPTLFAMELTLLDSLLFVRVREAELVDSLWLKGDRHTRAPHTTRFIEFFERVVGLVSTEVLLPWSAEERAATIARFVQVADRCRMLGNFHSLKSVLSGLKVLPVYRLGKTWRAFEEDFPGEFENWNELVCLMADDGRSHLYKMAIEKSLRSPPCLPFFGAFLLRVVDLYSAVDRAGMRRRHTRASGRTFSSSSTSSLTLGSNSSEVELHDVTDSLKTKTASPIKPKPAHQAGFFGAFASAWHTLRHTPKGPSQPGNEHPRLSDSGDAETIGSTSTHTRKMTYERKAHIRRLIIDYAKRLAEESGMAWRAGDSVTARDLLGAVMLTGVGSPINWGNLFAKVQTPGMPASSREEEIETERKKSAEYQLFESLFTHQMAAVQYSHRSDPAVREYLLRASYNTDEDNYRLSVSREPPSD